MLDVERLQRMLEQATTAAAPGPTAPPRGSFPSAAISVPRPSTRCRCPRPRPHLKERTRNDD
jgi:hypothetical protein